MDANKLGCRANQAVIKGLDDRVTALEQGGGSVDAYTKAETDALLADKQDVEIGTGEYTGFTVEEAIDDINDNYESLQTAVAGKEDAYLGWEVAVSDDYEDFVDNDGKFAQDFMVEVKNTLNYIEMDSLVLFRKGMMLSEYGTVVDSRQLQASENSMTVASMDITIKQVIVSPHDKLGCEYYRHDGEVRIESDPVSGDAFVTYEAHLSDPDDYEPTELTFTSGSLNATKFRIWVKAQE